MKKKDKALLFVEHIEEHLRKEMTGPDGKPYRLYGNLKVLCMICGKTIDQIAEEEGQAEQGHHAIR